MTTDPSTPAAPIRTFSTDPATVEEGHVTARWLRIAAGTFRGPSHGTTEGGSHPETTWSLEASDGSFTGYAQLAVFPGGVVRALFRDTSSSPPRDDVVLIEPPRRDGSTAVAAIDDPEAIRAVALRWADYLERLTPCDPDEIARRREDMNRIGLLWTIEISSGVHVSHVAPPSAHHRLVVNENPTVMDADPDLERAVDARWSDLTQIGRMRTSACVTWTVVSPEAGFVTGAPDAMETLRLRREFLEG